MIRKEEPVELHHRLQDITNAALKGATNPMGIECIKIVHKVVWTST